MPPNPKLWLEVALLLRGNQVIVSTTVGRCLLLLLPTVKEHL